MTTPNTITAGRPLADTPRPKADIMRKTYLTKDMDTLLTQQARMEHLGKSALIRKAITTYLDSQHIEA